MNDAAFHLLFCSRITVFFAAKAEQHISSHSYISSSVKHSTSRICFAPQSHMTNRSTPIAIPELSGRPCSRHFRNFSSNGTELRRTEILFFKSCSKRRLCSAASVNSPKPFANFHTVHIKFNSFSKPGTLRTRAARLASGNGHSYTTME